MTTLNSNYGKISQWPGESNAGDSINEFYRFLEEYSKPIEETILVSFKVIDSQNGQIISEHTTKIQAQQKAEILDLKHGTVRFFVKFI